MHMWMHVFNALVSQSVRPSVCLSALSVCLSALSVGQSRVCVCVSLSLSFSLSLSLSLSPSLFLNLDLLVVECASLVAPYRAILRYYRCDTPYRAILFQGGLHSPKMVRYPPWALSFTQAHLCDTPFCNVSRDNCAIPHKNKHDRVLRYYRCKSRAI